MILDKMLHHEKSSPLSNRQCIGTYCSTVLEIVVSMYKAGPQTCSDGLKRKEETVVEVVEDCQKRPSAA